MMRTTLAAATILALLAAPGFAMHDGEHAEQLASAGANAHAKTVAGKGTVRSVNASTRTVNLNHEAIQAIGWPPMTMDFTVAPEVDLTNVKQGQAIEFTLVPATGGNYTISRIGPQR